MAAVWVLNSVHSGMLMANTTTAKNSDSQRTDAGHTRPASSTTQPPMIGSHSMVLRMGKCTGMRYSLVLSQQQPAEQHAQADDHHERVVVQITGLAAAQDPREPAHRLGAAVHEHPVDYPAVATDPEDASERA